MTKTDQTEPESGDAPTASQGAPRRTRGIRFSDSEWQEVKAAAELHDVPAAEFVRKSILDVARGRAGAAPGSLAPLIERTFRYAYTLATHKLDELSREGRGEEMEKLAKEARANPGPVTGRRLQLNAATPRLHRPSHVRRLQLPNHLGRECHTRPWQWTRLTAEKRTWHTKSTARNS